MAGRLSESSTLLFSSGWVSTRNIILCLHRSPEQTVSVLCKTRRYQKKWEKSLYTYSAQLAEVWAHQDSISEVILTSEKKKNETVWWWRYWNTKLQGMVSEYGKNCVHTLSAMVADSVARDEGYNTANVQRSHHSLWRFKHYWQQFYRSV